MGMRLIDQELGGTTPLDIIVKFKDNRIEEKPSNIINLQEDDIEFDIELDESLLFESDQLSQEGWFNDDKIITIKSIHEYLENRGRSWQSSVFIFFNSSSQYD